MLSLSPPIFQSSRSLRTATENIYQAIRDWAVFQSSRSLRTATFTCRNMASVRSHFNPRGPCGPRHRHPGPRRESRHFNPRGPCGPRPAKEGGKESSREISILAVLADRDTIIICQPPVFSIFQSSRSLRTATAKTHKRSAASLYKAENILSAPKSFLREGRKNQRLPSPSPCVFRCEPARERPGAWPSH